MPKLRAGTDAGKAEHHCTVIDAEGKRRLPRRVANDEGHLLELIGEVMELSEGEPVTWAIDLNAGGAALLIALLAGHGQKLLYIPGRTVHHTSGSYRGDGKTDAKDAYVIADQARMRRDLQPLQTPDEIAVDLRILTARRYDLTADRTRAINRLRAQILEYFPALERAFDYSSSKAALVLLSGYQTPAGLHRIGEARLAAWQTERSETQSGGRCRAGGGTYPAHDDPRREDRRGHGAHPGQGRDGPGRGDRCHRHGDRGPVPRTPARRGDHQHARHRHPARRRVHRLHRRQLGRHRHIRTPGQHRRPGARPQGLRTYQRQHAPTTPLPPPSPARLLPLRPGRRPLLPNLKDLLRNARGARASPTSRLSSPSLLAASTCSGPSYGTSAPSPLSRPDAISQRHTLVTVRYPGP